ncbi:MAG: hypothetical protein Q8O03_03530 [Nanoarchaeota archaeon]|nr:hypothetical protein [Nanoarchaeota archaeon]
MNIVCTGISKSGKLDYFEEVLKYSEELHGQGKGNGKEVRLFSVGDVMTECLKKHTTVNEHILNKDDEQLGQAAAEAIKTIKIQLQDEKIRGVKERHNIFSTHTCFIWKHHWKEAHNEEFLSMLEPDLFVTILDHEKRIQERQHRDPQWASQDLSLETIALWQDKEARETEKWAKRLGKKHLVFGRNQSPETLYKMLNYPEAPVFYSNFPMTYLKNVKESYTKITENNSEMQKYGPVIDPRTIEIMKPEEGGDFSYTPLEKEMQKLLEKKIQKQKKQGKEVKLTELEKKVEEYLNYRKDLEKKIIKCLTVHRDLDYYVAKVDVDVLYFPELVLSFGGVAEVIKAHRCSKETYLILPEDLKDKNVGPFEVYHSLKLFFGTKEYHDFLLKRFKVLDMYK